MIKPFRRTSCNDHDTNFLRQPGMWPEMKWGDTHEMVPYS